MKQNLCVVLAGTEVDSFLCSIIQLCSPTHYSLYSYKILHQDVRAAVPTKTSASARTSINHLMQSTSRNIRRTVFLIRLIHRHRSDITEEGRQCQAMPGQLTIGRIVLVPPKIIIHPSMDSTRKRHTML